MQVYLNIYDLTRMNRIFCLCGIGLYHSGVQVDGKRNIDNEFSFGYTNHGTGVYKTKPKSEEKVYFRESIYLGEI